MCGAEWLSESNKPADADVSFFSKTENRYCIYSGDSKKYGFKTEDREEVTPYIYDMAYPFYGGTACVCLDGKYGYIDTDGETVLPFIYDRAAPFSEGLAYFAIGDEYGFMDESGNPVFYLDCESVSSFREGRAYFYKDGKYGYMNETGEVVIPPIYDDVGYFWGGLAIVRVGGFMGVIDRDGAEILPFEYDRITAMGDGIVLAVKDEQEQYFDQNGEVSYEGCGSGEIGHASTVLTNEITPGAGEYYACIAYMQEGDLGVEDIETIISDSPGIFQVTYKLYALGEAGKTYLYFYADAYGNYLSSMAYSAFFGETEGSCEMLATGYECGGSMGGDYMCLWYDEVTQQVMPGRYDHAGGFGGVGYSIDVYEETEHTFTSIDSWWYMTMDGEEYYSTGQNEEATAEEYEAVRARYRWIMLLD